MYCTRKKCPRPHSIPRATWFHVALIHDFIEREREKKTWKHALKDLLKGKQSEDENEIWSWGDDSEVKVLATEPEELNLNSGTHTVELKDL